MSTIGPYTQSSSYIDKQCNITVIAKGKEKNIYIKTYFAIDWLAQDICFLIFGKRKITGDHMHIRDMLIISFGS